MLQILPFGFDSARSCDDPVFPATNRYLPSCSGFFGKGDMQAEFEQASFALQPGEVSKIIETQSGLHIIERCVCSCQQ
jgi:hypothetical protein